MQIKFQFIKILTRWYVTPWQLNLFSSTSSRCWKGCGQVGTLFHCLWDCPLIFKFWLQVFFHVNKITGVTIPSDPKLVLLDLWNSPLRTHSERDIISVLLLAAKCLLASCWNKPRIPTIRQWYCKIWDLAAADKISDTIYCSDHSPCISMFTEVVFFFLVIVIKHSMLKNGCRLSTDVCSGIDMLTKFITLLFFSLYHIVFLKL